MASSAEEEPGHLREDRTNQRFDAVRKAVQKRHLITENIDAEYTAATKAKNDPKYYENQLADTFGLSKSPGMVKKFGKRSANAYSIDRVFDVPHNPFRSRMAIETPQNIVELYQRFRYYFQREPLVGTAVELHAEFPLSTFQMQHEDSSLQEEFNDMAEDLKLFEFMLDMSLEYYVIGECFPYGIFDNPDDPSCWEHFILLNPLNVQVESVSITDGRPNTSMRLNVDSTIKNIVKNGPNDRKTGDLYKRIPSDVVEACKTGDGTIALNSTQVSHFKRKGNYFKVRGESLLMRIIHLLSYRDKLRDAQVSVADRYVTPREIWKVGERELPATPDELQAVADMVAASYLDPSQAVVFHHALQVETIGGYDKVLPIRQEMEGVEDEMLIGLMLNRGFLDSNYGAYANMSVALDVLISRYLTFRNRLEMWLKDHVWGPICRIHNIYKPTEAELAHRIRVKNKKKRAWTPKVVWDKHELKDTNQKVQLLMQLRDKLDKGRPGFPKSIIYESLNYRDKTIKKLLDKEAKEDLIKGSTVKMQPPGLGGPSGIGGMPPAGGPGGDLALENLNAPIGEIPGGPMDQDLGKGKQVGPPASQNVQQPGNIGSPGGV